MSCRYRGKRFKHISSTMLIVHGDSRDTPRYAGGIIVADLTSNLPRCENHQSHSESEYNSRVGRGCPGMHGSTRHRHVTRVRLGHEVSQ